MNIKELQKNIKNAFNDSSLKITKDNKIIIGIQKEQILNILSFLKNQGFDHLALISCVDWIKEKQFEIVYILTTYTNGNTHIVLKTRVSRKEPEVMSATSIFENAEFYEREIHELFGVNFNGNKRLIPLFLYGEYKIPPFRKDFDTRKYVKNFYGSIPSLEDKK